MGSACADASAHLPSSSLIGLLALALLAPPPPPLLLLLLLLLLLPALVDRRVSLAFAISPSCCFRSSMSSSLVSWVVVVLSLALLLTSAVVATHTSNPRVAREVHVCLSSVMFTEPSDGLFQQKA